MVEPWRSPVRLVVELRRVLRSTVVEAPWVIERKDLALPAVQEQVNAVRCGRKLPRTALGQQQFALE